MTNWIASSRCSEINVYHTDPECNALGRIGSPRVIDDEQVALRELRECRVCQHIRTDYSGYTKLHAKLIAADPDEVSR